MTGLLHLHGIDKTRMKSVPHASLWFSNRVCSIEIAIKLGAWSKHLFCLPLFILKTQTVFLSSRNDEDIAKKGKENMLFICTPYKTTYSNPKSVVLSIF